MTRIFLYDTTLRDGSQGEGVNFSLQDKLLITARLDAMGFDYIEGGYPLSNPKDAAYFREVRDLDLAHAKVTAFGMTRRRDVAPEDDIGMRALVEAKTQAITIVGKSWDLHVHDVLGVSLEENLRMIGDSVAYCASHAPEVVYDAEHFFDGFRRNPDYALQTIRAAADAGARWIVLCDTNGGTLPEDVASALDQVRAAIDTPLGIHTHNDGELAVANALAAVRHGARQVQGTINGLGERCGNMDLCSVAANLALKYPDYELLRPGRLAQLNRALAVRLRDRQHEFPPRPGVRRHECLRAQGRYARSRCTQECRELRAHRPVDRRQRAPRPGLGALGQVQHRREAQRIRTPAGWRAAGQGARRRAGIGE